MEVDQQHFDVHLLPILRHIANAEFVAFDLEMSGISSSMKREEKPNLQEVYEDIKQAAETYQVLQVGITCVEKDEEHDMYIARPYNFNLSPLFLEKERLGIERKFSFSSGAIHFLMGEKVLFDIAAPFKTGVPYLSRDEEEYARKKFNNVVHNDVTINPGDMDALTFYRNARQTIREWVNEPKGDEKRDYVNISLNGRYGVRLVHQLVRTEFPKLFSRYVRDAEFMQITVRDEEREALFAKQKLLNFENNIAKQTGLRFVFEALFGGDLSKINPKWFTIDSEGKPAWTDLVAKKREIQDIINTLQIRRPALVGHNIHTDLAFMYKTFIGNLPDTYQEFANEIHTLCPIVIDTKYLATHNCGSMDTKSDLQGLVEQFNNQPLPLVCLAEKYSSYGGKHKNHEAGYDSWMTALLLIKLAAKLALQYSATQAQANKENTVVLTGSRNESRANMAWSPASSSSSGSNGGVSLLDMNNDELELFLGKRFLNSLPASPNVDTSNNNNNRVSRDDDNGLPVIQPQPKCPKLRGPDEKQELPFGHHMAQVMGGERYLKRAVGKGEVEQWIPEWSDGFWREYVNRCRVFQAEEGFYVLRGLPKANELPEASYFLGGRDFSGVRNLPGATDDW